jgi:transcriptional regulator with XRE-family HTH domain
MPDPTLIGQPSQPSQFPRGPRPQPGRPDQPERPATPLLRTTLGDVLRRLRLDQGRTLADVARTANVSMPYLSELERGRKEASSEVLAALCAALGIGLSDLIEQVGHDLAEHQERRAPVIRLDRAVLGRSGTSSRPAREGPTSPVALLAA